MSEKCDDCGECDVELYRCANCGHIVCDESVRWCCDEYDECNGDYFCFRCEPEEVSDE